MMKKSERCDEMAEGFKIAGNQLLKYEGNETDVVVPSHVKSIRDMAFRNNTKIKRVVLPEGLEEIGTFAFYGCDCLTEINIPSTVTYIGNGAFAWCLKLKKINIPQGVRTILKSTFYKCIALDEAVLPSSISTIEHSAFGFCESLETIKLPSHLKVIGPNIFEECHSLKALILPSTLTTIGDKAFFHCPRLRKLVIPKSVDQIGDFAFETQGRLTLIFEEERHLKARMFDSHWQLVIAMKNDHHSYDLIDSYLPDIDLMEWKVEARPILLANFLETYERHQGASKEKYINWIQSYLSELVAFCVENQRFKALNCGLEECLITKEAVSPYLNKITDREEKAKIMNYQKTVSMAASIDDLEADLLDMF